MVWTQPRVPGTSVAVMPCRAATATGPCPTPVANPVAGGQTWFVLTRGLGSSTTTSLGHVPCTGTVCPLDTFVVLFQVTIDVLPPPAAA